MYPIFWVKMPFSTWSDPRPAPPFSLPYSFKFLPIGTGIEPFRIFLHLLGVQVRLCMVVLVVIEDLLELHVALVQYPSQVYLR
jgi:hypothetical protein